MARNVTALNGPTWVYFVYCPHNGLLYVGIASDVQQRISQHRSTKKWWRDEVDQVLCELFPTRKQALEVEAHAIFVMRPLYNRAGEAPPDAQPHEVAPHRWTDMRFFDATGTPV